MKKMIALVLSLCIIGGSAPAALEYTADCAITANAAEIADSGAYGENLTWTLDSEGALTISGTGYMNNCSVTSVKTSSNAPAEVVFGSDATPWYDHRENIYKIVVEEGVTSIGSYAFVNLFNARSMSLPESLTIVNDAAFALCTSLTSVSFPDSVTSIGWSTFLYCKSLSSVALPAELKTLKSKTFSYCDSLETVTVPANVNQIDTSAFYRCSSLKAIEVDEASAYFTSSEGILFTKDMTELSRCPEGWTGTEYTVPDSVTSIGRSAFEYCSVLEAVTLPYSVKSIGINAFFCQDLALKTVTILDPACEIYDGSNTICKFLSSTNDPSDVYICGSTGSTAQAYAEKYGRNFKIIGGLGDVNSDASVDSSDAAMILRHYAKFQSDGAGTLTDAQLAVADYNSDSSIDSSDAALILRAYAENQSK